MIVSLLAAALAESAPASRDPQCLEAGAPVPCIAPAQAEAKTGAEIYRAFFIDGYGNARPAVAFERRPGQDPRLVVYMQGRRMEAPASNAAWQAVREGARFADRALVDLPPPPPPVDDIAAFPNRCLDPWTMSVELINAPPQGDAAAAPVRSRREASCSTGLATQYAFQLAALAVQHLPACDALRKDRLRNDVERLAQCATFNGDRVAAAQLFNQIARGAALRGDLAPDQAWAEWMGASARPTLDWAGEIVTEKGWGERHVPKFLAGKQAALGSIQVLAETFEGLGARRVKVTGRIETVSKTGPQRRQTAPYEQVWSWDSRQWIVESWTVRPFTTRSPG